MKTRHIFIAFTVILILLLVSSPGSAQQQTYKVVKGDSLYKIGKKFNTTPEALKEFNGLKNDKLSIGQTLKIPVKQTAAAVKSTPSALAGKSSAKAAANKEQPQIQKTQQARKETQTYAVRNGDTLSGIAQSFSISLKDLSAANNLKNNNKLKIGQVLTIPGGNNNTVVAETQAAKTVETTSEPAAAALRLANRPDSKPAAKENGKKEEPTVRDRLVEAGFNMLGVRYRFGGTSETTGLDCSALVKNLFDKFGFTLPRSSREQYKQGEKVAKEDLQKGDLVFFSSGGKTPTHVGIYIGDNQFLHAASRARKVVISELGKTWYEFRYLGARRIMELWFDEPKSLDDASFEWAHQLLDAWEDSQIPLADTPLEGLAATVVPKENPTTAAD